MSFFLLLLRVDLRLLEIVSVCNDSNLSTARVSQTFIAKPIFSDKPALLAQIVQTPSSDPFLWCHSSTLRQKES